MSISASVNLHASSFVPGSRASATITLQAEQHPIASSFSSQLTSPPRARFVQSASAASAASSFASSQDAVAIADYVVCEFSGRWSADRNWVVSDPHRQADPARNMDYHSQAPIASATSLKKTQKIADPTLGPYPWSAALADANSIGGGGREGQSGSIFRSQPLVVCEREQVPVGSIVSFDVDCVLPEQLPPSFRGTAMRYNYAIVIVVKSPDRRLPRVLRVPFRVVPAGGTAFDEQKGLKVMPVPTPRDTGPHPNRFLEGENYAALTMSARLLKRAPPDDIEIALALSLNGRLTPYLPLGSQGRAIEAGSGGDDDSLEELAFLSNVNGKTQESTDTDSEAGPHSKRNVLHVYSITKGSEPVARLHLAKGVHQLGDTVSITFCFQGPVPCYRVDACLEAQEIVNAAFLTGQPTKHVTNGSQSGTIFRKVYGEQGEFVESCRNTNITFSLPQEAPPTFTTEVVSVRWLLSFVFLTPRTKPRVHENLDRVAENGQNNEVEEIQENNTFNRKSEGKIRRSTSLADMATFLPHSSPPDCDTLRWKLPITVTGRRGAAHCGARS